MSEPSASIDIRPRQENDLPALGRLLVEVHERDGYPVEGVADPVAWLRSEHLLAAWTAELNGDVVGHVALTSPTDDDAAAQLWAKQSGEPLDSIAVGGRLFVGTRALGHHLGQRLTKTAADYARQIGRRGVLDVMTKDQAAIRTYRSLGWQEIGEITHHFGQGQTVPALAFIAPE